MTSSTQRVAKRIAAIACTSLAIACDGAAARMDGSLEDARVARVEDAEIPDAGRMIDGGRRLDGGMRDGGMRDAGMRDAGMRDAGMRDGGRDPGSDAGPPVCADDSECDNGAYCDGTEVCAPDTPSLDPFGCAAGAPPCATGTCDESIDTCSPCAIDDDGDNDGYAAIACGGTDCADTMPRIHPDAEETCDGIDEDCDDISDEGLPLFTFYLDVDMDGWGGELTTMLCGEAAPWLATSGDCRDGDPSAHPSAMEIPRDGIDNDCNGRTDEVSRRIAGGITALGGTVAAGTRRVSASSFERGARSCGPTRCVEGALRP